MADDRTKPGGQDRTRINVHEDYELRYWMSELGVDEVSLRSAVAEVGPEVEHVRKLLKK